MTEQDTVQGGQNAQVANTVPDTTTPETLLSKPIAILQLIVFSMIGLVIFFVPFTIGEKSTILFDHGATYLVNQQHTLSVTFYLC